MTENPDSPTQGTNSAKSLHRNDIYGDLDSDSGNPAIPAATVILLRDIDGDGKPEVLMLRKNSKIAFGGMWVFPGGRIDPEDFPEERRARAGSP